jgi:AcrR family transcriptional regulator
VTPADPHADTRESILDAARAHFLAKGVEATTMRGIASTVGLSATAIYHHFRDKDALLEELCLRDFISLAVALQKIGKIADPVERVRRMGLAYVDFAMEHPEVYRFMFMTARPAPKGEAVFAKKGNPEQDAYAFLQQTVAEGIAQGRYRPEFADADELAQMVWSGVHGLASLYIAHADDPWIDWRDPRKTVHGLVDATLRGLTI